MQEINFEDRQVNLNQRMQKAIATGGKVELLVGNHQGRLVGLSVDIIQKKESK